MDPKLQEALDKIPAELHEALETGKPFSLSVMPFDYGDEKVSSIDFPRRLKGKDMRGLKGNMDISDMMILLSRLIAKPSGFIDCLDGFDLQVAFSIVNYFLSTSPAIGNS